MFLDVHRELRKEKAESERHEGTQAASVKFGIELKEQVWPVHISERLCFYVRHHE